MSGSTARTPSGALCARRCRSPGRRLWRPADRLADWLGQGCEVFAYFNNDQEANAVFDAAWLAERLGAS